MGPRGIPREVGSTLGLGDTGMGLGFEDALTTHHSKDCGKAHFMESTKGEAGESSNSPASMSAPEATRIDVADVTTEHVVSVLPPTATQSEFIAYLDALYPPGEKMLIGKQFVKGDGGTGYIPTEVLTPKTALYVSTGSFIKDRADDDGKLRASAENIEHCAFLMLDDIGTKSKTPGLEPTWKIETSPGNYQWGYVYSERPTKAEQSAALAALIDAGYCDPGANNPVRWSRIPGSMNLKPKHNGFIARLEAFAPERRFVLSEICAALGVVPSEARAQSHSGGQRVRVKDDGSDDVLAWLSENDHVMAGANPEGWYEVRCPDAKKHSDGREGARYLPATRAFKCMHSHGEDWTSERFLKWVTDEGGPERRYGLRPELLFGKTGDTSNSSTVPPAPTVPPVPDHSQLFMTEEFHRHGLDVNKYSSVVAPVANGHVGKFFIRFGEGFMVEYQEGKGRVRGHGSPCPAFFGDFTDARMIFTTDNWFSAAALHEATGAPVLCVEGWAFGEITTDEGESVRALHTSILGIIRPDLKVRIITAAMTDNQRKQLATFRILMMEENAGVRAFTLPEGAATVGEWAVGRYGERAGWPDSNEIARVMFKGDHAALKAMPDDELAEAAVSYTTSTADRFGKYHLDLTDRGAGSYILSKLGVGSFYYLKDQGTWVQWHNGAWRDIGKEPMKLVNVAAHGYKLRAAALYKNAADLVEKNGGTQTEESKKKKRDADAFERRSAVLSSTTGRGHILKDLRCREEVAVFSTVFDSDRWTIGVKNGLLDLRTGVVREVTKEDMVRRSCTVRYSPDCVDTPNGKRIAQFLREITSTGYTKRPEWAGGGATFEECPARLAYLQRRLGVASLVGVNLLTALEIIHGEGSNGKSVILKFIMSVLGNAGDGGYAKTLPAGAIMSHYTGRDADAPSPYLASTPGARVVVMNEAKDNDKLNEQLIKSVTGGDEISTRGLYKEPMTFLPAFTPILLTNPLPEVTEGGKALWDRLAPFHLMCRWARPGCSEEEKALLLPEDRWYGDIAPYDKDAGEYLLWWLVEGVLAYGKSGLGEVPADVKASLASYKAAADVFSVWMGDTGHGFGKESDYVPVSDLYTSYRFWCLNNGKKPVASNKFTARLVENHPALKAGKEGNSLRVIYGVSRLSKTDETAETAETAV